MPADHPLQLAYAAPTVLFCSPFQREAMIDAQLSARCRFAPLALKKAELDRQQARQDDYAAQRRAWAAACGWPLPQERKKGMKA